MEIDIVDATSGKSIIVLCNLPSTNTKISDVKREYLKQKKLAIGRQSYKRDPKGKALKDEETLRSSDRKLYLKDLGPQIGWKTVFLAEYFGPLVVYLIFYLRPEFIYGPNAKSGVSPVVDIAAVCWSFHYLKRLLETVFVHRFSHATMPIFNLFKNCSYYWGFAAFVAYYVNHPLYTSPIFKYIQVFTGLAGFLLNEFGNLSIHLALRNLRRPGSKDRKIPFPTSNPLTWLFKLVSCPNYTYEVGAWLWFSIMTQCLPAFIFTIAGFYQMAIWAKGKHRNYKKEFDNYPKNRKAIVPFLL